MMEVKQKEQILRRIGISLPKEQIEEGYALLESSSEFCQYLSLLKRSNHEQAEDQFINKIVTSHQKLTEQSSNPQIIQKRETCTFIIRAINPDEIKSLTERAFFNSFNLQRNTMNDFSPEQRNNELTYNLRDVNKKNGEEARGRGEQEEEEKCICGKVIPGSEWVQCSNQQKCRGSNWYHLECAGFNIKDIESLKEKDFFCEACKRSERQEQSANSVRKRRKND